MTRVSVSIWSIHHTWWYNASAMIPIRDSFEDTHDTHTPAWFTFRLREPTTSYRYSNSWRPVLSMKLNLSYILKWQQYNIQSWMVYIFKYIFPSDMWCVSKSTRSILCTIPMWRVFLCQRKLRSRSISEISAGDERERGHALHER